MKELKLSLFELNKTTVYSFKKVLNAIKFSQTCNVGEMILVMIATHI